MKNKSILWLETTITPYCNPNRCRGHFAPQCFVGCVRRRRTTGRDSKHSAGNSIDDYTAERIGGVKTLRHLNPSQKSWGPADCYSRSEGSYVDDHADMTEVKSRRQMIGCDRIAFACWEFSNRTAWQPSRAHSVRPLGRRRTRAADLRIRTIDGGPSHWKRWSRIRSE